MLWIISWQLLVLAAELTEFFRKVNFHLCRCKCFRNCGDAPRRRITHAEVSWLVCLMPAAPASKPVSKPNIMVGTLPTQEKTAVPTTALTKGMEMVKPT